MRVLIVEEDAALASFLQKVLTMEGHQVDCAEDGETAMDYVESRCLDLVVLELSLQRRNGTELLKIIRELCPDTAVLVVNGRVELDRRVYCLDAGADDYLQKPFSFQELAARCRAILRRRSRLARPLLEFGGVTMNLTARAVRFIAAPVELTAKEFMLLEVLVRRRGECITHAELMAEVWPGSLESGLSVVDVYITYLRRKFADAQRLHSDAIAVAQVIETVNGTGYRLRSTAYPREATCGC